MYYSVGMTRRGPRGPVPVYQQIAESIRADIQSGKLKPGQLLPPEGEMCKEHGAARATVRNGLQVLRNEGLIYTIHAEGSYVGPEDAPKIRDPWPYEQVATGLIEQILNGKYEPDQVLPSETELMQDLGFSKKTVRGAMELLREQGWAYTVPAIGTFVTSRDQWPARDDSE